MNIPVTALEIMLNTAQLAARNRLITLRDIEIILAKAEIICLTVPEWARKYVRLDYLPHNVANAYAYPASGTGVTASFTEDGNPFNIKISRKRCNGGPRSRLLIHGIRSDPTIAEFSHKLQNDILKSWGFSPAHHTIQL